MNDDCNEKSRQSPSDGAWCKLALEFAPGIVFRLDRQGQIVDGNQRSMAFAELHGNVPQKRPVHDVLGIHKGPELDHLLQTPVNQHRSHLFSTGLDDGPESWYLLTAASLCDEFLVLYIQDVTEQEKERHRSQAVETKFTELFRNMPSGVAIYRPVDNGLDFEFVDFNPAACRMGQLSREDVIGKRLSHVFPGVSTFGLMEVLRDVHQSGEPALLPVNEYSDTRVTGHYENRVFKMPDGDIVAVYDDVTDRIRMTLELQDSKDRYALVTRAANDGLWDWRVQSDEVYYSPRWKELLGYEDSELPNDFSEWKSRLHPQDSDRALRALNNFLEGDGTTFVLRHRLRHRNGTYRTILAKASCIRDPDGRPLRLAGSHTDITEREHVETERGRLIALLEHHTDLIAIAHFEGKVLYINRAGKELLDVSDQQVESLNFLDPLPDAERERFINEIAPIIREHGSLRWETTLIQMETNQEIPVQVHAFLMDRTKEKPLVAINVRSILPEIEERRKRQRMEAQLSQRQRLESVGTLARGVAHEINNPLTGILAYAELLKRRANDDERIAEYADTIMHESKRVESIVQNLLTFAREEEENEQSVDFQEILENTLTLIQAVFRKEAITTEVELEEALPKLFCRPRKLQHALMNLLTNARDALNQRYQKRDPNKRIRITAGKQDDGFVWIRVRDHGKGIPKEIRDKVFDPFFTTKPLNYSTGLGLAVTSGIITEQRGELRVQSVPEEFTEFEILMPTKRAPDSSPLGK